MKFGPSTDFGQRVKSFRS